MDIHNTIITRENVVEFLSIPGANGEHAVSVVAGLIQRNNELDQMLQLSEVEPGKAKKGKK